MQPSMGAEELFHGLSLVPARVVQVEPGGVTAQPPGEVPQGFEKAFPISSHRRDLATSSQHRSHPARKVQPSAVATAVHNAQPLAAFGPASSQTAMQAETRLVLKHHRLTPTQAAQFRTPWNMRASSARACR